MTRFFLSLLMVFSLIACSQVKLLPSKNQTTELAALDQGKELAKVNNMSIREGYLDLLGRLNPRVKVQMSNPATKKQLLGNLVEQELMYQESVRRGLDQRQDVKEKAALYSRVIIAQSLLEDETEKKAREYYDQHKDDEFTKIKISQIQLNFKKPDEENKDEQIQAQASAKPAPSPASAESLKQEALARAQAARQRLASGEDFAKVAEEASDDKISKRKGGDLGDIARKDKRMERLGLEKLNLAAFQMKNGDLSEPIETEKGYHLLKVTSDPTLVPFDEAKKIIEFQIQKQVRDDLVKELKDKAKIVYQEPQEPALPPMDSTQPNAAPAEGQPAPGENAPPAPPPPQPAEHKDISPVVPKPKIAEPKKAAPPPAATQGATPGSAKPEQGGAAPEPGAAPTPEGVPAPTTPPNPAPTTPTAPGAPTPVQTQP